MVQNYNLQTATKKIFALAGIFCNHQYQSDSVKFCNDLNDFLSYSLF